ncbi:MAG TPA: 4'-phosphopantetheinyl transferase superfamily protein [bacterium]|nr:4'-phosphopantetheinyl transferase superfamily protein [bacterium]
MALPAEGEVQIHLLRWKGLPHVRSAFLSLLSPAEQERHSQIQIPERKKEFLASRLFLRILLAGHMGMEMGEIELDQQEKGKPFVRNGALKFNLSHTEGLVACSLGREEVGVDLEKTGSLNQLDWRLLSRRFFSAKEQDYLVGQPTHRRALTFLSIFTRKEARAKLSGEGLRLSLPDFTVPLPPMERSETESIEYFTFTMEKGEYCLSQATRNLGRKPLRYRIYVWNEAILTRALEPHLWRRRLPWK